MTTTFTGPVVSENGFEGSITLPTDITATSLSATSGLAIFGATLVTTQPSAITTAALPTLTTNQLTGFTTTQVAALNTDLAAILTSVAALKTMGITA